MCWALHMTPEVPRFQAQADLEEPENGSLLKVGTHVPLPLKEALEAASTLWFAQFLGEGALP